MNDVAIRQTNDRGRGVFASRNFNLGEVVVYGRMLYRVKERTAHSFQIARDVHMQLDTVSRSINHACEPNTGVRNNAFHAYDFIALRDIQKGEEITWDYETTEYVSISVKDCLCESTYCRKTLHGFRYRGEFLQKKYGIYIADYLTHVTQTSLSFP